MSIFHFFYKINLKNEKLDIYLHKSIESYEKNRRREII